MKPTASDLLGETPRARYARAWREWRLTGRSPDPRLRQYDVLSSEFELPRRPHVRYVVPRLTWILLEFRTRGWYYNAAVSEKHRMALELRARVDFWRKVGCRPASPRAPLP